MIELSNTEDRPSLTYEHDCPYVDVHYRYIRRHAGKSALNLTTRTQDMLIEQYHRQNICPPTHDERNLPTTEWADFVELTRD